MTSTSKNLVIAGGGIVALLFSLSPYLGKGRYQLGQSSNNSSTWKLDTVTGQVWGCGSQDMTCRPLTNDPPTTE